MTKPLTTKLFKIFAPTLTASRDPASGKKRIEGIASSTIKDRHGDQLTLKALKKMETSALGMTIFMNHSYEIPKDVFGTVERTRVTKSADLDSKTGEAIYDLRMGIGVAESNPEAVKTFELIEEDKVQLGLSIGAMIPDGGAVFEKGKNPGDSRVLIDDLDLVETSVIGIPANPRAWVDYAVKAFLGVYPEDKIAPARRKSAFEEFMDGEDVKYEDEEVPNDLVPTLDDDPDLVTKGEEIDFDDAHFALDAPDTVKEVWSTAYKNALPDSAFACPGSRKYPHHSKSGTVDRGHLAAALSRVGDASNDQCGKAHLEAHAAKFGMGEKDVTPDLTKDGGGQHPHAHLHEHEHSHGWDNNKTVHNHEHAHQHSHEHESDHEHASDMNDYQHDHHHDDSWDAEHAHKGTAHEGETLTTSSATPDVTKTRVTVWETEDGKTVEVDTGRQKSKSDGVQSAQTSSETAGGLADDSVGTKALDDGAALRLAAETISDSTGIVKAVFAQLNAARSDATAARGERDQAIEIARKILADTTDLIGRIGDLPAGRKTGGAQAIKGDLDALKDIYSDDVRKFMKKG